jgi:hypothetical protein
VPALKYNWKRFWCPREGTFALIDGGYLADPDEKYGAIFNKDLKPLSEWDSATCLVLLGEPGIGKSTAVQEYFQPNSGVAPASVILKNLNQYGDETRLISDLFGVPEITEWVSGTHEITLVLDSLDECLLRIDTLVHILTDQFSRLPCDRLRLRVACRTAEWPPTLETQLRRVWGTDAVKVCELVPLRRQDVAEASRASGINADCFMSEVERLGAVQLANRPLTLNFLLGLFKRAGGFPSSQSEVFEQGIKLLCDEPDDMRRRSRKVGPRLDPEARFVVASRIAAVMSFANRNAIYAGRSNQTEHVEGDLNLTELAGGNEDIGGTPLTVDRNSIQEAISTGLFTARGALRLGWSHQTHRDYLAARYCVQVGIAGRRLLNLLIAPGDSEQKVIPQLHGVAAWLAVMNSEVYSHLLVHEPDLLLRSDVVLADQAGRQALCDGLLDRCARDEFRLTMADSRDMFRKLEHPGLAEQIKGRLQNKQGHLGMRRLAIEIAMACELKELVEVFVAIALDPQEDISLRTRAVRALEYTGNEEAKARLHPLAIEDQPGDDKLELRGVTLDLLWPQHLSPEDVFSRLIPPPQGFAGVYGYFVERILPDRLPHEAIGVALRWMEAQPERHGMHHDFKELMDRLVVRTWDLCQSDEEIGQLAATLLTRLRVDFHLVQGRNDDLQRVVAGDILKRRKIIENMLPLFGDDREPHLVLMGPVPLLYPEDLEWLLDVARRSENPAVKTACGYLIRRLVFHYRPDAGEQVFRVAQQDPVLGPVLASLFDPVPLNSEEAKHARLFTRHSQPPTAEQRPTKKEVEIFIGKMLEAIERSQLHAWDNLVRALNADVIEDGDHKDNWGGLVSSSGWRHLGDADHLRVLAAARRVIEGWNPSIDKWIGTNEVGVMELRGVEALALLMEVQPESLEQLSSEVWARWVPAIVACINSSSVGEDAIRRSLMQEAITRAPDFFLLTLPKVLGPGVNDAKAQRVVELLPENIPTSVESALMDVARDTRTSTGVVETILEFLIRRKTQAAVRYLYALCALRVAGTMGLEPRVAVAIGLLLKYGEWRRIWPLSRKHPLLFRAAIERIADQEGYHDKDQRLANQLSEGQLLDLYLWMRKTYPPSEDPVHEGAFSPDLRDHLQTLRDGLLSQLVGRGTAEACRCLDLLVEELPADRWLKVLVAQGREAWRQRSWTPLAPREFLAISNRAQARAVFDGDHLMEVVLESLEDFGRKLRQESSLLNGLWNERTRGRFRPKDEAQLADLIKTYLDQELRRKEAIVNREVQVRKRQRSDIQVDAIWHRSGQPQDRLTLIIEVKGSWNRDLFTAMDAQLAQRYLDGSGFRHGVYVTGWFNSQSWDRRDGRRRRSTVARDDLTHRLDEQARGLTTNGRRISNCVLDCSLDGAGGPSPLPDRRTLSKIAGEIIHYFEHELLPVMEQITMRRHRRYDRRQLKHQLVTRMERTFSRIHRVLPHVPVTAARPAEALKHIDLIIDTLMPGSSIRKRSGGGWMRELIRRGETKIQPALQALGIPREKWDEIVSILTEPFRRQLQADERRNLDQWHQNWWRSSANIEIHQLAGRIDRMGRQPLSCRLIRRLEQIAKLYENVAVLYERYLIEHLLMLDAVFGGVRLTRGRRSMLSEAVGEAKKWSHLNVILEPVNVGLRNAMHHGRYHIDPRTRMLMWEDTNKLACSLSYSQLAADLRRLWGATAFLAFLPFAAQIVQLKQAWQELGGRQSRCNLARSSVPHSITGPAGSAKP